MKFGYLSSFHLFSFLVISFSRLYLVTSVLNFRSAINCRLINYIIKNIVIPAAATAPNTIRLICIGLVCGLLGLFGISELDIGVGVGDGAGVGLGVGVGDGAGVGFGVGVGDGAGVGFGVGVGDGAGVGFGVGVGGGVVPLPGVFTVTVAVLDVTEAEPPVALTTTWK